MELYVVLGVGREATLEEIKRAYRRLARKFHPDINPGDRRAAERFRQISVAYETLSDPERRRTYDRQGYVGLDVIDAGVEFQGFDFSMAVEHAQAPTFGELFADVLQGRAGLTGVPEQGADLHATLAVTFEEALRGARRPLGVSRLERCAPCHGLGAVKVPETRCVSCDGTGHVRGVRGHMVFARTCPACAGAGVVRHRVCAACGGEGVGVHTGPVVVEVPPGVADGTHLVIPGEGHAGRRGGPAGAMRLSIEVQPHDHFRRVGDDLVFDLPVAIHEAALGARIEIASFDGVARLRVPPGTQAGQRLRLRERGAPGRDGRRGDLVAIVRLVLPRQLDERSRALLKEFGERNPEDVRVPVGLAAEARSTPPGAVPAGDAHAGRPVPPPATADDDRG